MATVLFLGLEKKTPKTVQLNAYQLTASDLQLMPVLGATGPAEATAVSKASYNQSQVTGTKWPLH